MNFGILEYCKNSMHLARANKHKELMPEHLFYVSLKLSNDFIRYVESKGCSVSQLQNSLINYFNTLEKFRTPEEPSISNNYLAVVTYIASTENTTYLGLLQAIMALNDTSMAKMLIIRHNLLSDNVQQEQQTILDNFARNMTKDAKEGKIEKIIGRDYEIDRIKKILCRKNKNNPILVGEAGVGKTAIVEQLALEMKDDTTIYSLDMMSLIASGQLEMILKAILKELEDKDNIVLFIDEIHTIVGTGNYKNADMSNLLKPALSRNKVKIIGATTFLEYKNTIEKNKALNRRFTRINVEQPSVEEAIEMIKANKASFEKYHKIVLKDEIIERSVEYAKKIFVDKQLPDSAIDLIDELGAYCKTEKIKEPSVEKLEEVLNKVTKTKSNFEFNKGEKLKNLEQTLKDTIFGQDDTINSVISVLERNYAGLGNENSPLGVFLFTGNSGTGKTEFCKQLAKGLDIHFERFDMSEYSQPHEQAKLIGSPAGYVGYDDGGILTNAIRANPHCVLLFDEIEKANPRIMNTFLQIFDNAQLTDSSGIKVSFKNTIIVMTSNLGTKEPNKMGFIEELNEKENRAIKDFFAPEFINRIDRICYFKDLNKETLYDIVDKEVSLLAKKVKGLTIKLNDEVKDFLVERGYKKEYGARILKRTIYNEISSKLSKEILYGDLKYGGNIELVIENNEIKILINIKKGKK